MTGLDPNTSVPPDQLYEWRYEYYDDEEPVSFEGLEAHRYSVVIGFWVGVAVFVIFMFFVLTLLTKTGAPHPESAEPCQKHVRLSGLVEDDVPPAGPPIPDDNNNRAGLSSRPPLASSRSLPHCYGDEEEEERRGVGLWGGGGASRGGRGLGGGAASPEEEEGEEEEEGLVLASSPGQETVLLSHFDIPNFVSSEQGPMLGEDELEQGPMLGEDD